MKDESDPACEGEGLPFPKIGDLPRERWGAGDFSDSSFRLPPSSFLAD
jgi:hypothetical protein